MKKDLILKYALQNAVNFKGKANPGAVIGKVLAESKSDPKEVAIEVNKIIKEVNSMKLEDQITKLKSLDPKLLEKKKAEKKDLPELEGAKPGKVVTRIPPEPSKYNHIGHALSFLINYIYAKRYKGKAILRFEDTNPAKAEQEYVDAMKKDVLKYLDIKPDKIVFVSDDMPKFYKLAEQTIKENKSYVCFCNRDTMQDLRHKGEECSCRTKDQKTNLKDWKDMLTGKYKEGEATLRLKIDMQADNQVMRDPVIMRICTIKHYRQKNKYKVWPMYDFENAVEEHFCGITHILRSNEFGTMRAELQEYIKDLFSFKKQIIRDYGRFNITGATTQGREIRELIEQKKVSGWDDPRLVTLKALKRRGIIKEAYYELVKEVGLSPSPSNIDFTRIAAINRRLLDPKAYRYFFVKDPIKIKVENAPSKKVELDLHPENKKGGRKFQTEDEFLITKEDFNKIQSGKLIRLMEVLNFTKKRNKLIYDSNDVETYRKNGTAIIHWLTPKDTINIEVLMDDGKLIQGLGEKTLSQVKEGEVIQFERFGFCRLDKKTKDKLTFWFTHR